MADCFSEADLIRQAQLVGNNNSVSQINNMPGMAGHNAALNSQTQANINSQVNTTNNLINNINNTISSTANINPSQNSVPFQGQVSKAAHLLGAMAIDPAKAQAGLNAQRQKVTERIQIMQQANPVNYSTLQSWFLNTATALKERFASAQAPLEKFLLAFTPDEGNTAGANRRVADLNSAAGKISAFYTDVYDSQLAPIVKRANDLARSTGVTPEEARHDLGEAAKALFMPERTEYLLKKMDQEIAKLEKEVNRSSFPEEELVEQLNTAKSNRDSFARACYLDSPVDPQVGYRYTTAGWSIPEAERLLQDIASKYNIDRQTLENDARMFNNAHKYLMDKRAETGLVGTDLTSNADLQSMNYYFPLRTRADVNVGYVNDGAVFNYGSFHEMRGVNDPTHLADSFEVLERMTARTASELAYNDLALDLYATSVRYKDDEVRPIIALDYDSLVRQAQYDKVAHVTFNMRLTTDAAQQAQSARAKLKGDFGGGLIANIPIKHADGTTTLQRKILMFNPEWKNEQLNLDGNILNTALRYEDRKSNPLAVGALTKATGFLSQLYTRFSPTFAPINHIRDAGERFVNIGNQSYRLESGALVGGDVFRPAFIAMGPKAHETIIQVMQGRLDPNSEMGRYWQEYKSSGLKQEFTLGQDYKNQAQLAEILQKQNSDRPAGLLRKILNDPKLRGFKQVLSTLNENTVKKALQYVDVYNDYFNNIAPFTQYATLRSHGVEAGSAQSGVRELMDLRGRGQWTGTLRALYPFVVPTIQGGMAMLKGMGLAPNARGEFRPTMKGLTTYAAMLAAYSAIYAFAKDALGTDEDGNSYADSLPVTDLARSIPIPGSNKGDIIKIPLPFGGSQITTTLVATTDRFLRGKIDLNEATFDLVSAFVRNVSPTELPAYLDREDPIKALVQMFSPYAIQGFVTTGMNISSRGKALTFEQESTGQMPIAEQGRASTNLWYHKIARAVHQTTGIDLAPEQWENLINSYVGGMLKAIPEYYKEQNIRAAGIDKNTQEILGPVLTALGFSSIYKHTGDLNRYNYYREKEKVDAKVRELGIVPPAGLKGEERLAWKVNKLQEKGMDEETIHRVIVFDAADKELEKLSRDIKDKVKSNGAILDYEDRDGLKEIFEAWALDREEKYKAALARINY